MLMNLVAPKDAAKLDILFSKLTTEGPFEGFNFHLSSILMIFVQKLQLLV
jgi:hypothetical protein